MEGRNEFLEFIGTSIGFYHILLNRYSEFTRQLQRGLRLWIVTDPVAVGPAERTKQACIEIVGRRKGQQGKK